MATFKCSTPDCDNVNSRTGAFCSCFKHCRQCHLDNRGTCPPNCKNYPICKRKVHKNPSGGFYSHCGDKCRAPFCANYPVCEKKACKNPKGGFFSHCGNTCRFS